jgi:hypothetical protein
MAEHGLIARDVGVERPSRLAKESTSEETLENDEYRLIRSDLVTTERKGMSCDEIDASTEIEHVGREMSSEMDPFRRILKRLLWP